MQIVYKQNEKLITKKKKTMTYQIAQSFSMLSIAAYAFFPLNKISSLFQLQLFHPLSILINKYSFFQPAHLYDFNPYITLIQLSLFLSPSFTCIKVLSIIFSQLRTLFLAVFFMLFEKLFTPTLRIETEDGFGN